MADENIIPGDQPLSDDTPDENGGSQPASDQANDDAQAALEAARNAISSLGDLASDATGSSDAADPAAGGSPFDLPQFSMGASPEQSRAITLLSDVNLNVKIELGRTRMLVEDVLKLTEGAVVELDKLAGDPVDVYVNERHVARGEVLVLNDNFCVRINEILEAIDAPQEKAG
ncbi:MAG: flagellar motor switch protein FliN [Phycisphaerales bacterium]|nr:MAG: flagellar motor switch protein FliN [Phycisphaerales bacterium]